MESSTKILRRLLDERGVEWKAWDGTHSITVWHDETYLYEFVEYRLVNGAKQVSNCPSDNDGHCELTIKVFNCTPAQAIAATLGAGTCKLTMDGTDGCFGCSECLENIPPLANFCPNCGAKVVEPTTNDVDVEVEQ